MTKKNIILGILIVFIFSSIKETNVFAVDNYAFARSYCETGWNGTFIVTGETTGTCNNFTNSSCEDGYSRTDYSNISSERFTYDDTKIICGYVDLSPQTVKEQKVCKFIEVQDSVLGQTIIATGRGIPTTLRLIKNNVIYKLPVLENTVQQFDNGTFIAEFATIDNITSQTLIPTGTFAADCFGPDGPSGQQHKINITR